MTLLQIAFAEVVACWILWSAPFFRSARRGGSQKPVVTAPAARWGIVLQSVSYALVWSIPSVAVNAGRPPSAIRLVLSMFVGPVSVALVWSAVKHLGKQWRVDAALNQDHDLVRTGAYSLVRHPIYASMLGMLLSSGLMWTWWPLLPVAIVVFLAGTEIRVRAEDRLLAGRFPEPFAAYKARVPAYIPFLR
jgi:protein-S-isoprenylcysteine O-methyltransferase Ste14